MASEKVSRKMVLEIKYVNANNAVIHTENSKLLLDLNCSPKELEKTVVNSCGIEHSAAKRGFSDHSIELYYVEPGNPKKAAFILRKDETIGMLRASESHSLFVKVIQRVASFQKGTVNIVFESSSSTSTDANCCDSSTLTKNTALGKSPKESKKTTTRKSRSKLPQTHEKLKDFLEKTNDVRLADDGKSMKCLLCGKNPKLDNSKRSNSGHLKYFRRVHRCSVRAEVEVSKTRKIDEFYCPVEKRPVCKRQVCKAAQCTTRQYHGQSWYTAFESVRNTDIA